MEDPLAEIIRLLGGADDNTLVWSPDRQPITVAELAALYRTDNAIPGWTAEMGGRFAVTTVFIPARAEPDAPLWETGLWADGRPQTIAARYLTKADAQEGHRLWVQGMHAALAKVATGSVGPLAPYTCGTCGAVSHHPMDSQTGYCGRCHAFTRDIG